MEEILKAIPEKLEPTGLYLTEAERKHIAEALRKAGFQQCEETTDAPDQVQGMARTICGLNTDKGCFCAGGYCNYNCLAYEKSKTLIAQGYRKVERGEWVYQEYSMGHHIGRCTKCECEADMTNFCPNCGADMRKEGERK